MTTTECIRLIRDKDVGVNWAALDVPTRTLGFALINKWIKGELQRILSRVT